jgi:hypothetical protein
VHPSTPPLRRCEEGGFGEQEVTSLRQLARARVAREGSRRRTREDAPGEHGVDVVNLACAVLGHVPPAVLRRKAYRHRARRDVHCELYNTSRTPKKIDTKSENRNSYDSR